MNNYDFFPKLSRHELDEYHNKNGVFYADYSKNYKLVSIDCLHRCVYCDVTEKECGGEPFSLDHFRPSKVFANKFNGELLVHPYNLYLSCQKCNVLKSSDWQGDVNSKNGSSFIANRGYLDRFSSNFDSYMSVNDVGEIISLLKTGPVNYMIKRLELNRPNRKYIRYKRIINKKAFFLLDSIERVYNITIEQLQANVIDKQTAINKLIEIKEIRVQIQQIICDK